MPRMPVFQKQIKDGILVFAGDDLVAVENHADGIQTNDSFFKAATRCGVLQVLDRRSNECHVASAIPQKIANDRVDALDGCIWQTRWVDVLDQLVNQFVAQHFFFGSSRRSPTYTSVYWAIT